MTTLTAVTPAIVARNYTRTELLREAHRVFTHPTPIIALMLHYLEHHSTPDLLYSAAEPAPLPVHCCPACGAQLTLNETE